MVPLHGLGSDQVEKANIPDQGIKAYYVDEHKRADAFMLQDRLLSLTNNELDHTSIILFVLPDALAADSPWYTDVFMKLAKRGFLSLFCIDEAHSIAQAGRCFRTEFVDAVANAKTMLDTIPHPVPRVIMSATLRSTDQSTCTTLLGGGGSKCHAR